MKEGDIVYCKKSFELKTLVTPTTTYTRTWFIKGNYYKIYVNPKSDNFYLIDEEGDTNEVILKEYFTDHFYTKQELRKFKLEKIYERG